MTDASILRSRRVFHRDGEPSKYEDGVVIFAPLADDADDPIPQDNAYLGLDISSWEDMDSPDVLTLTIEPGDHLNPADE